MIARFRNRQIDLLTSFCPVKAWCSRLSKDQPISTCRSVLSVQSYWVWHKSTAALGILLRSTLPVAP